VRLLAPEIITLARPPYALLLRDTEAREEEAQHGASAQFAPLLLFLPLRSK
jgi:hypothetical protein